MVVKRPQSAPQPSPRAEPDVELLEQLVKKSLDVNPAMRDGKSTGEVLAALRQQAISRAKTSAPAGTAGTAGAAEPRRDMSERRRGTIAFFFEQKADELKGLLEGIEVRERELQAEKKALQQRVTEDLVDFLQLMAGAVDSPEGKDVLRQHKQFLAQLNITEAELAARARSKR